MADRWQNQEEAFQFAMKHPSVMLDMEMGTGKTRTALDVVFERSDVRTILVVCPKAVIPVWQENLDKFHKWDAWQIWDKRSGSIDSKAKDLKLWQESFAGLDHFGKLFVVVNYDIVWRRAMGEHLKKCTFDMIILDESHRAKAAGTKVSKYLAMIGKKTKYKMCLSGTPMANSPLDVYGQYRFLDPTIFGTNYNLFLQEYAIMSRTDHPFVVGYKNQGKLSEKFRSIAYTCKMSDIADRIKLPDALPPICRYVNLPVKDMKTCKQLSKDFIAECGNGVVAVNNVLVKMLRLQQIASGFCYTKEDVFSESEMKELNTAKQDELLDILSDMSPVASLVIFVVFRHDIGVAIESARKSKREVFELSGDKNELEEWKKADPGAVIVVQIQAGAEGVDFTKANHAVYYSLPHSLALYNQSRARLYRPGQTRPVSFIHLLAKDTIDESIYDALINKKDIVESIKDGTFNFGYIK
jgi:SNF2 family DNA or RNA helicase